MQPARMYRRNLPHIQTVGKSYFVTFCTKGHWVIPEAERNIVLDCCRYTHGRSVFLHCAVVMPDHVHLVLTPMADPAGQPFLLEKLLKGIKGTAGRKICQALGRTGPVWQAESFDHILRSDESVEAKADYVIMNPVRKGLANEPALYPWLWRARNEQDV